MKPLIQTYRSAWPEIDERFIREHLSRLDGTYFEIFQEQEIYRHLLSLSRLSPTHPVEVLFDRVEEEMVQCTILAFDYPAQFSLLTGVLAGMGMNILTGDAFTYEKRSKTSAGRRAATASRPDGDDIFRRRRIIDRFVGTLDTPLPYMEWEDQLKARMEQITLLLERGGEQSVTEAMQKVQQMVADRFARLGVRSGEILYPMQIEIDNGGTDRTRLKLISKDTPGFLYALSTSLSLHDILIEHVSVRTAGGNVEDQIDLVDGRGRKIEDPDKLDRLKMSVLITKQFTYFLGMASNPISALSRFEHLLQEIFGHPGREGSVDLLTSPDTLQSLARLLGASDFLWEDFIRIQYETLLPMLHRKSIQRVAWTGETLDRRMRDELAGAMSFEEQKTRLNDFKDREIYLIDLDHILNPEVDFRVFAERLTLLAEKVVTKSAELVYEDLCSRFGHPTTIGGLETAYAIMGLGKLGGAALGYASDIELLFVYSDNGRTNGPTSIENAEFFDRLVRGLIGFIRAKREGIFHVDVRLRPFGNAGPLASSLETFCSYYGQGGQAHSYERLALVRMRAIGGDQGLGKRVERLRDEMVYAARSVDLVQLKELREKQFLENTRGGRLNAKFSPGGLVDLEYGVQILQVFHGNTSSKIRTPRIHEALRGLNHAEIMSHHEILVLNGAYDFLRNLINAMRMLRGSARDLFLPPPEAEEFAHLARRMGYQQGGPLSPAEQLRMDFETHTAAVRTFVERYFGRDVLPGKEPGSIADLVLSDQISPDSAADLLKGGGFKDPSRAHVNLKELAGAGSRRSTFARLALLALDLLKRVPDPDMALNNWERFMRSLGSSEFHYNLLLSQPMRLEILLNILAGSQFLSDTLIRNPVFLDWVTIPKILHHVRTREEMEEDLRGMMQTAQGKREWLNRLRRFRRREILRIGTRDICLKVSPRVVLQELTALAEAIVSLALEELIGRKKMEVPPPFCIMAFGKLGGRELNYSSDIDLLGIMGDLDHPDAQSRMMQEDHKEIFTHIMETLRADLSMHTEEGYAYRVDLRLRPFGRSGELVSTLSGLIDYYREKASLWEIQALLKIRPVAGNKAMGYRFLDAVRPLLLKRRDRAMIAGSISRMRRRAVAAGIKPGTSTDVKSGIGGLRDVEFLVQGLQLIHAPENPALLEGNTLAALSLLGEARVLGPPLVEQLQNDYLFLRRVEHFLQMLDDRKIHALPREPDELESLSRRVMGPESGSMAFMAEMNACLGRIRAVYNDFVGTGD
ncbi:MAG: glutamate-ammonia-ligase adenylyltransferase [Desulfobacteraceae bacterium]|nr:MAG: glutamate-ammonia-ligase adenylyltransferase [Desulfobacteraceae bacterium]